MSTENNSESKYGATDEGFDDDDELFSRNTGRGKSKKDSTESTTEETETETTADSTTETGGSDATESVEESNDQVVEFESESSQTEQQTPGESPTGHSEDSEITATSETTSGTSGDQTTSAEPKVPGIDVSAVDPENDNEFPFIFERNGTQDAREHDWIYFQPHIEDAYTEAKRQAEDKYGDKMTETDVKEAIFIAGLQNFDGAIDVLHEWGFRPETEE